MSNIQRGESGFPEDVGRLLGATHNLARQLRLLNTITNALFPGQRMMPTNKYIRSLKKERQELGKQILAHLGFGNSEESEINWVKQLESSAELQERLLPHAKELADKMHEIRDKFIACVQAFQKVHTIRKNTGPEAIMNLSLKHDQLKDDISTAEIKNDEAKVRRLRADSELLDAQIKQMHEVYNSIRCHLLYNETTSLTPENIMTTLCVYVENHVKFL